MATEHEPLPISACEGLMIPSPVTNEPEATFWTQGCNLKTFLFESQSQIWIFLF